MTAILVTARDLTMRFGPQGPPALDGISADECAAFVAENLAADKLALATVNPAKGQ